MRRSPWPTPRVTDRDIHWTDPPDGTKSFTRTMDEAG
jgi:hypothetical protein